MSFFCRNYRETSQLCANLRPLSPSQPPGEFSSCLPSTGLGTQQPIHVSSQVMEDLVVRLVTLFLRVYYWKCFIVDKILNTRWITPLLSWMLNSPWKENGGNTLEVNVLAFIGLKKWLLKRYIVMVKMHVGMSGIPQNVSVTLMNAVLFQIAAPLSLVPYLEPSPWPQDQHL